MSIWEGDCIEILLETQSHRYYQIAISPAGAVVDLDRKASKNDWPRWSSDAEVATRINDDSWSVEVRIPAAGVEQEELLPFKGVAGNRPSEAFPWYFNVCRQRMHESGSEYSAFSPTGKGFHCPEAFAKMYVGMKKSAVPKRDRPVKTG